MAAGIFISYRRSDATKDARAVYERLGREFGARSVFMDIEGLQYGDDFVEALAQQLTDCQVVLALIGPTWLSATNSLGQRRLDDSADFVRLELATALNRKDLRVIPVLLDGSRLPNEAELPDDLRLLTRRQAMPLRDTSFDADMQHLCRSLRRLLSSPSSHPTPADKTSTADERPPHGSRPEAAAGPAAPASTPRPDPRRQRPASSRRALLWTAIAAGAAVLSWWGLNDPSAPVASETTEFTGTSPPPITATPARSGPESDAAAGPRLGSIATAPGTTGPVRAECVEANTVASTSLPDIEARLAFVGVPAGRWQVIPSKDRWWVYMGRYADESTARRKLAEVRKLIPDADVTTSGDPLHLHPGLILARRDTRSDAGSALSRVESSGIRSARVVDVPQPLRLRIQASHQELARQSALSTLAFTYTDCAP